jgi:hypothetical protein
VQAVEIVVLGPERDERQLISSAADATWYFAAVTVADASDASRYKSPHFFVLNSMESESWTSVAMKSSALVVTGIAICLVFYYITT